MDATLSEASMNIGAIALNYRDYEAALEAFDTALATDADNIEGQLSRGVALRGLDRYDEAEQAYNGVLGADERNLAAIYNLGVLNQEYRQDYQAALDNFETYMRYDMQGSSALAEDVEQRIDVLRELIELLGPQTTGAESRIEEQ